MYVENRRPEVERPGQATQKTCLYNPYLSRTSPTNSPLVTEQRGPRDGQDILPREVLTEKLLKRQHPKDPFKSKSRLKTARPLNYTAKSEIHLTGIAWGAK